MAPGGIGDRTGTVPKFRARNSAAHPSMMEKDTLMNGIPNNLGSKDWQPVRDTQLSHPKKRGNVEAGFLDLVEQPNTRNTGSLDSFPAASRAGQRHRTPATYPRTRFAAALPVQQRKAMENLRQKMTFNDVDESNTGSEVSDMSTKKQDGATCTGGHRQNVPMASRNHNLSDASNSSGMHAATTKNNTSKVNTSKMQLDNEQIISRLTQIREYIKQTTTIMDGLKNAGDTKDVREHLTRFAHLRYMLTTQEQEYVSLLYAVMNLGEESQVMVNGSEQSDDYMAAGKASFSTQNIMNLVDQSEESSEEVEGGSPETIAKRNELVQKIIESQEKLKALQDQQSLLNTLKQKAQSRLDAVKALVEEEEPNALPAVEQDSDTSSRGLQDDLDMLQQRMNAIQDINTNRNMLACVIGDEEVENEGDQQELQQKLQDMQRKKKEMDDLISELRQSTAHPEREWKNEEAGKAIPQTPNYARARQTLQNAQDMLQTASAAEKRAEMTVMKKRLSQLEDLIASLDISPASQGRYAGVIGQEEVHGATLGDNEEGELVNVSRLEDAKEKLQQLQELLSIVEAAKDQGQQLSEPPAQEFPGFDDSADIAPVSCDQPLKARKRSEGGSSKMNESDTSRQLSLGGHASGAHLDETETSTLVNRYGMGSIALSKRHVAPQQSSNARQQMSVLSNRIQEKEPLPSSRRREAEYDFLNHRHEGDSMQAEHGKLMAVQQQLMKLRQDFPVNQATESEKDDHKDAAKDSLIKHELKAGASKQEAWYEMQQRQLLQEELRIRHRQLQALMKKDQGQSNVCNHDNRSDISGDKSEVVGYSLLEGTTNATWGGSTEETLEDFGEQDNDVRENSDAYSSDEAEEGRDDAYHEGYQEQEFPVVQRERNECNLAANRDCMNFALDPACVPVSTQAKNRIGQSTASTSMPYRQQPVGPHNVWGKKTGDGATATKATWTPASSVHARQENLRTADELVSESDGGFSYASQNIASWQQLQRQLEGTISLCQSMVLEQSKLPLGLSPVGVPGIGGPGISAPGLGSAPNSRSVTLPVSDILSIYTNQLYQQQMLLILNQCYQLLWVQQREMNSLQQAVQRLVQEKITGEARNSCSNLNLLSQDPSLLDGDGHSWPAGSSVHTQSASHPQVQHQLQSQLQLHPHPNLSHIAQSQPISLTTQTSQPLQQKQSQSTGTFPPYFSHNFLQAGATAAPTHSTAVPSTQASTTVSTGLAAAHPVLNVTNQTRPSDSTAALSSQQVPNLEQRNLGSMTVPSSAPNNLISTNTGSIQTTNSSGNPSTGTATATPTLNNQVPPGTRANNYWDNFRSYSRQNLLSSHKANDSIASSEASSLLAGMHGPQGSTYSSQNTQLPSESDALRSSVRHVPKLDLQSVMVQSKQKKQKINKDQSHHTNADNRTRASSTYRPGLSAGISGTAFMGSTGASSTASSSASMKAPSTSSQATAREIQSQEKDMSSSVPNENVAFESLRESIYSEVATLISQNECRPYFLIELFRELQMVSSDYLRQRVLYMIQELVGRYLIEDSTYQGSPRNRQHQFDAGCWTMTAGSEQTPSESMATSDDEEGRSGARLEQQKQQSRSAKNLSYCVLQSQDVSSGHLPQVDYAEMVENSESLRAVTPSSGSEQPFASDSLGETVIHLDRTVQQQREQGGCRPTTVEASSPANFQVTSPGTQPQGLPKNVMKNKNVPPGSQNPPADLFSSTGEGGLSGTAAVTDTVVGNAATRELDISVQSVLVELLPFLKAHLDDVCTPQLLATIRRLVLQLSHAGVKRMPQMQSATVQQHGSKLFHKQLDAVLQDSLMKFHGRRLTEVGEDMLMSISEVLFNELAFLRLVETVGGVQRDRLRNKFLQTMPVEQSSVPNDPPAVDMDGASAMSNAGFSFLGLGEEAGLQQMATGKLHQDFAVTEETLQPNLSPGKSDSTASDCPVNRSERLSCDLTSVGVPVLSTHMKLQVPMGAMAPDDVAGEDSQVMAAEPDHHGISPELQQAEPVVSRNMPANLERNFGSYDGDGEGEVPECNGDLAEADQSRESRDLEQDTGLSQGELEPEGSLLQEPEGEPEHQDSHAEGAFSAQNSQAEGINGLGDGLSSEEAEDELNRVDEELVAVTAYAHISGEIPLCEVEQVEQDRELGLDEVPTKLSAPEIAQCQSEEQHCSSLLDEILSAAESELAGEPPQTTHTESH